MGQAKNRGSLEDRIKQSQEKQDNFYGSKATIEEIIKGLDLPADSKAIGYVIHLPEKDEFVANIKDTAEIFSVAYTGRPELAERYETPEKAIFDAKKITKHKLLVCVLLESSTQYFINDLWANH